MIDIMAVFYEDSSGLSTFFQENHKKWRVLQIPIPNGSRFLESTPAWFHDQKDSCQDRIMWLKPVNQFLLTIRLVTKVGEFQHLSILIATHIIFYYNL